MSSRTNQFPVTVTNNLTEQIRVQVVVHTDNPQRLTVPPSDLVTVEPGQSVTVNIRPEATSNGLVIARAYVATADGHRVSPDTSITVEVTDLGVVAWIIVGVSGLVLVGATAWRIRQVRRRTAAAAEHREGRMSDATGGGRRLISATAVMASGTMVSRVLGLVRAMLIAFVLGNGTRQVEAFNFANTVPTTLYLLLAGGTLNNVLVPQIVRAVTHDEDGGKAFVDRIITGFVLVLGVLTVLVTVATPLVMSRLRPRLDGAADGRPLATRCC